VDANAVGAEVEPEAQHVFELLTDLRVLPVEVRLLGREQVEVPLAGGTVWVAYPGPRRPAEDGLPIVARQHAVRPATGTDPGELACRRAGTGKQCLAEPRVRVGAMVRYHVDDDPDAQLVCLADQLLRLGEASEHRIDRAVVGHVIAGVGLWRRVP